MIVGAITHVISNNPLKGYGIFAETGKDCKDMIRVLFVCHGSICRSPAAEAIFKQEAKKRGRAGEFECASLALSDEEIGNDIYPPMKRELTRQGIPFERHYARRLTQRDLDGCDYLFYMDSSNARRLAWLVHDPKGISKPVFAYSPTIDEIEDPWYSGRYELVVQQLVRCVNDILDHI